MAQVSNLRIDVQSGASRLYASWSFTAPSGSSGGSGGTGGTGGVIKTGSIVSIKSGATYYNGASMPSWVQSRRWYVSQIKGDRAVLGKSVDGIYNINSPVNTKYLTVVSSSNSTSTSTSTSSTTGGTLDHFEVKWSYSTGNKDQSGTPIWFTDGTTETTEKNSLYSPPENATIVKISVKPVSKTYKVKVGDNEVDRNYWTGTAVTSQYYINSMPPSEMSSAPTVKIDKYVLTATVENIDDPKADYIEFEVYSGDSPYTKAWVQVKTQRAVYVCKVFAGHKYRVRCRTVNATAYDYLYGEWSPFSSEESTVPDSVTNVTCRAASRSSVRVSWDASDSATSYEVEYATSESYFDSSSEPHSLTVTDTTAYVTGLETGKEWFFRVRAVNENGNSGWSNVVSTVIGTPPEAPTTWSLTTTVIVGELIYLYWVHNCEDGSHMTESEIKLIVNGDERIITVDGTVTDEEQDEPIYQYSFDSLNYDEGAEILWSVRTKGILDEYGPWSVQRTINLYAPPALSLSISADDEGVINTLPIDISTSAWPESQTPISYNVTIISDTTYDSEDVIGNPIIVSAGSEVYSKVFNSSDRNFALSLSAGDLMLKNDQTYTLNVIVSMNSGLTAEATTKFTVKWEVYEYYPDAGISIDYGSLSAYITPICIGYSGDLVDGVTLSVYRREANGRFTEIGTNIINSGVDTVTDPHPALDYARYRIVARNEATGNVNYEDIPGYPVKEPSIVIQWDEIWSEFNYLNEDGSENFPWSGSMIRLPYNVDITEKYDPDVSLIEYIGREHPVSYYGTQRGETATWSTDIDKQDVETIYALRRLAAWRGDVYVREPSGTGYWAHVKVGMPIKHLSLTVPVTLEVTRVEGGM